MDGSGVLPHTFNAPRTVPASQFVQGQIWICQELISKQGGRKKVEIEQIMKDRMTAQPRLLESTTAPALSELNTISWNPNSRAYSVIKNNLHAKR